MKTLCKRKVPHRTGVKIAERHNKGHNDIMTELKIRLQNVRTLK